MGSIQWRHPGLTAFRFMDGGQSLVTVGTDRTIRFWDRAGGKSTRAVALQSMPEWPLDLSPDGTTLAGRAGTKLVFWATATGKEIRTLDTGDAGMHQLTFSPDGRLLAVTRGNGTVQLWDWQDGKERKLPGAGREGLDSTCHVAFSPDSRLIAVGVWWLEPLRIHDTATGQELYRLDCRAMRSAFSPDGKRLAISTQKTGAGKDPGEVRLLELPAGKEVATFPAITDAFPHLLTFSPDGKLLACGDYRQTSILDVGNGKVRYRLPGFDQLAFTSDGRLLAGKRGPGLRFFDTATGRELGDRPSSFPGLLENVNQLATRPDGRELASLNERENAIYVWDTSTGRLTRRLPLLHKDQGLVSGLVFAADGRTLLVGWWNGVVEFWDLAAGKLQRTVRLHDPTPLEAGGGLGYRLFNVSADGTQLSTLEPQVGREVSFCRRFAVWDSATGNLVEGYALTPGHQVCSWPADGSVLAVPADDGVELRQGTSGQVLAHIAGPSRGGIVSASVDHRLIAVLGTTEPGRPYGRPIPNGEVGIWEASSGKEVARLAAGPVAHLALVNGGRCLVTTDERFLHVWDLAAGRERRRWALPAGPVDAWGTTIVSELVALPDGRKVVTALYDGTALVWDLSPALIAPERSARKLDGAALASCWADLANDEAKRAYAAIWRLAEVPELTVPFLGDHLQPAPEPDQRQVRRLIRDLDHEQFEVREKAERELRQMGSAAIPALRQAVEDGPPPETRRRLERLLAGPRTAPLGAQALRELRALHALELMATPDAIDLIRRLAGGASQAPLTCQAVAALGRLARHAPGQP
jgi:WD40 repeat protein